MKERSLLQDLPSAMQDSFLEQAFHQQDQQDLLASACPVCRQWQQLALKSLRSITAEPGTATAADQLGSWLAKHGTSLVSLTSLSLSLARYGAGPTSMPARLLPISALSQLGSLSIGGHGSAMDISLSPLVHLTRLRLNHVDPSQALVQSVPGLTRLQVLDLSHTAAGCLEPGFVRAVASSLVQLTHLDLSNPLLLRSEAVEALASLSALTGLQQLQLAGVQVHAGHLAKLPQLPIRAIFIVSLAAQAGLVTTWLQGCVGQLDRLELLCDCYPDSLLDHESMARLMSAMCPPAAVLNSLCLWGCTRQFGRYLAQVCTMTQLMSLELWSCGVEDGMLLQLSSALSCLRELDISDNRGIMGDQGSMEALAAGLPHLTRLKLSKVPGLADAVQKAFGARIIDEQEVRYRITYILQPQQRGGGV